MRTYLSLLDGQQLDGQNWDGKEPRRSSWLFAVIWVTLAGILFFGVRTFDVSKLFGGVLQKSIETQEYYGGEITVEDSTYLVSIREVNRWHGRSRVVDMKQLRHSNPVDIAGHTFVESNDWCWIISMTVSDDPKANGVGKHPMVRSPRGEWRLEFEQASDDGSRPYTKEQIDFVIKRLDLAVRQIRNKEHLQERWIWNPELQKLERVSDREEKGETKVVKEGGT